jgi:hypothetical protein
MVPQVRARVLGANLGSLKIGTNIVEFVYPILSQRAAQHALRPR